MLARTAASRRAAATAAPRIATRGRTPFALTTPRATTLGGSGSVRPLSLWPFGKKTDPTLPVYFAQQPAARSSATAPRGSSSGGGGGGRRLLWRRLRYAIFSGLVYYALWQIYMSVVLDPLLDWAEAEWDSLSEKEKQEIEEAEDEDEEGEEPLLFLPFPFTTKQIAQPPYRGSDPEWKEFVRVNKDDKKQKEIKKTLAESVRQRVEANPAIARLMGGKTTKVRKMWLDIIYPPAPPPKHYISGLIVDYDGLFWGDRSIEAVAANQLDAILYPKAVAMAVFTFWDVLLKKSRDDLARRLGLSSHQEPETTWQSMMMSRGKDQPPPSNPFSPVAGRQQQAGSLLGDGSSQQQQAKSSSSSQAGSIQGGPPDFTGLFKKLGGGTGGEGEAAEPSGVMSQSVMMAFQAASLTLARNWKRSEQHVGRGCIRVDGLVELQGRSAFMVVYVLGWFDPKANKFVNVETKLKHLVQTKQRPMGGN